MELAVSATHNGGSQGTGNREQGDMMKVFHENGGFRTTECTDIPSPTITATQCRMIMQQAAGSRQQAAGRTLASLFTECLQWLK
jgi:hypothetical protein